MSDHVAIVNKRLPRTTIDKVALYVKGKVSAPYVVVEFGYGETKKGQTYKIQRQRKRSSLYSTFWS
jgi:hypothetical protein